MNRSYRPEIKRNRKGDDERKDEITMTYAEKNFDKATEIVIPINVRMAGKEYEINVHFVPIAPVNDKFVRNFDQRLITGHIVAYAAVIENDDLPHKINICSILGKVYEQVSKLDKNLNFVSSNIFIGDLVGPTVIEPYWKLNESDMPKYSIAKRAIESIPDFKEKANKIFDDPKYSEKLGLAFRGI